MSISSAYEAVVRVLKSECVQVHERFTWKASDLTMTLWPSGTLSLWSHSTPGNEDCASWQPGSPLANAVMEMTR